MKEREIETLDQAPAGWHALDVWREKSRSWDWVALMIDVDPDDLKYCRCKFAWLYVDPKDYRPGSRVAREAWVRVPGKYRNKGAAWDAVCDMLERAIAESW